MLTPSVKPLFSSYIQQLHYYPPPSLIDHCLQEYNKHKFIDKTRSIRLGWQSKTHSIPQLQTVLDYIDDHTVTTKLVHGDAWININPTGGYNVSHIHPNSDYTFVYYLTDSNVPLVLTNPHLYEQHNATVSLSDTVRTQFNIQPYYSITPHQGDILMFPSYIPHHVECNNEMHDRISISWNSDSMNVPRVLNTTPH